VITKIPGGWRREQFIKGLPQLGTEVDNWRLIQTQDYVSEFGEAVKPTEWIDSVFTEQEVQTLYDHGVEPNYLFTYENPAFHCDQCQQLLRVSELEYDTLDGIGEDAYLETSTKCPHCDAWEACQITRETIQQALDRIHQNETLRSLCRDRLFPQDIVAGRNAERPAFPTSPTGPPAGPG